MLPSLSRFIFETLVVSLLFSALCLMQITESPFQWTQLFIATTGSLLLYGLKRLVVVFVKKRPNTPHYIVLTSTGFALLLSISMEYSLFGLLHSIGLTCLYLALIVSKSALTQS